MEIKLIKTVVLIYGIFGLFMTIHRLSTGIDPQHDFIRYFNLAWYVSIIANVFVPKLYAENQKIMLPILILGLILNLSWIFKIV